MPAFVMFGSAIPAAADGHDHDHEHHYFEGNAQDCENPDFIDDAASVGLDVPGQTLFDVDSAERDGVEQNEIIRGTVHSEGKLLDVELLDDSYEITAVVVKGSPKYALYVEDPWTDLHAPDHASEPGAGVGDVRTGDEVKYPGISNWFVCGVKVNKTPPPTDEPTEEPTQTPTEEPTETPTEEPTETPTEEPTETPTEEPTETPTEEPTQTPTVAPTEEPTESPTDTPTESPSPSPTEDEGGLPDTGTSPATLLLIGLTLLGGAALALRARFVKA